MSEFVKVSTKNTGPKPKPQTSNYKQPGVAGRGKRMELARNLDAALRDYSLPLGENLRLGFRV